jgi:WD40 repeat protein
MRSLGTSGVKLAVLAAVAGTLLTVGAMWHSNAADPPPTPQPLVVPKMAHAPAPAPAAAAAGGYVDDVQFSGDGTLYTVVAGGKVGVYDAATQKKVGELPGEAARFVMCNSRPLSVIGPPEGGNLPAPDMNALWVMGPDGVTVHTVVDRKVSTPAHTYPRPKTKSPWHVVAFAPGGQRYAAHFGMFAGLYDTKTGFEPVRLDQQYERDNFFIGGPMGKQLVFSPDGKRVAAVAVVIAHGTCGLAVYDAEAGRRLFAVTGDVGDGPTAAAFSPDGKTLAVGYKDRVKFLAADTGKETGTLGTPGPVTAVAYRPDGKTLAAAVQNPVWVGFWADPRKVGEKAEVRLYDLSADRMTRWLDGFEGGAAQTQLQVNALAFSPDGKRLIAGTGSPDMVQFPSKLPKAGEVKVWRLDAADKPPGTPTWRELRKLDESGPITAVAFDPNGKSFAVGGPRTQPLLYSADGHLVPIAVPLDTGTFALSFAPDGKHFATARKDDVARYQAGSWVLVKWPDGVDPIKTAGVTAVAHSPDGKRLAVSTGKLTRVLDLNGGGEVSMNGPPAAEKNPNPVPAGVAWAPDGRRIALIRHEKWQGKWAALLWGAGSGEPMMPLGGHDDPVQSVAWSKDGTLVATGGGDGKVVLWDPATGKELRRVDVGGRSGKSDVRALAFSPDGGTLAAAVEFDEGKNALRVVLIQPATGNRYQDLQFFNLPPSALAFSPDGKTLVVGCGRRDTDPGRLAREGKPDPGEVRIFTTEPEPKAPPAPAPAEEADADGGWTQTVTLTHHAGPVDSVAFAPDGKWFVSGGADGRVFTWDATALPLNRGDVIDPVTRRRAFKSDAAALRPRELGAVIPPGPHTAVAVSPDGKLVAATREKVTGFFDPVKRQTVLMDPPVPGGRAVVFGPVGYRVAVSDGRRTVVHSTPPIGELTIAAPEGLPAGPLPAGMAWSPDGKRLALLRHERYGGTWPVVVVSTLPSAEELTLLRGHTDRATAVAWSADGKMIATGGTDGKVLLWDASTYAERARVDLRGRNSPCVVNALTFSPDGKTLAAAVRVLPGEPGAVVRGANRVVLLNPATGTETEVLTPSPAPVRGLAFSPDGWTLLAAYGIDRAEVKPIMSPDEMKAAGGIAVYRR